MSTCSTRNFLDQLRWRGMLHQTAGADIDAYLATPGRVAYCGFDPTADSLTVGNLVAIKLLMHWQRAGHRPIMLFGGGTGLIGDPSGKDAERRLHTRDQIEANVAGQRRIVERLLDCEGPNGARLLNNIDWLDQLGFIDVLRDVGKHFSVNAMIQKDSVRERLHHREQGISYTEFSYMLLQAYDFLYLYRRYGCSVQMAGSDQYGNIVAGMDLIRRAEGSQAYAITAKLLTKSDGKKVGKSESGAVWLSADRTSAYQFYQFWINTDDADVETFLRWFTFFERERIDELLAEQRAAPQLRPAQRALAAEMTELVHGADALRAVEQASGALFGGGDVRELSAALLGEVFADVPHSAHGRDELVGRPLVEVLPLTTLANSKREAREFLANGAISVNGVRVDAAATIAAEDLLYGETLLLKRGKKRWHAARLAGRD